MNFLQKNRAFFYSSPLEGEVAKAWAYASKPLAFAGGGFGIKAKFYFAFMHPTPNPSLKGRGIGISWSAVILFMCMALPVYAAPVTPQNSMPSFTAPLGGLLGNKNGKGEDTVNIPADDSLEWHEDEQVYIARGRAKARRGDVLVEADLLKAYNRKKPDGASEVWKLAAEGNVKVTGTKQQAIGDNGEYDIDSKKMILTGKQLTFRTENETVTASDSFEYWENEKIAVARGDAKAVGKDRTVDADELFIYFKQDKKGNQQPDHMEAKGNVRGAGKEGAATCDNAVYHPGPDTAILTGDVNITKGGSQLKGDKVEANFKTGVSKLLNTGSGRVHALILASPGAEPAAAKAAP